MTRAPYFAALSVAVLTVGLHGCNGGEAPLGSDSDSSVGNVDSSAEAVDSAESGRDAGGNSATLPAPYAAMCTKYSLACTTTQNPPTMVGTYKGSGTTTETSSATWTVGS